MAASTSRPSIRRFSNAQTEKKLNEKFSQIQQDDLFKKFDLIKQREPNREDKTEYYVYCRIKDSSTLFDDVHSALKILFEN